MNESLIEFPAEISVKAMGLNADDFEACVSALVLPHIEPDPVSVSTLPSSKGKYMSVRVHFTAQNLEQLHQVYAALRAEPRVLYTL